MARYSTDSQEIKTASIDVLETNELVAATITRIGSIAESLRVGWGGGSEHVFAQLMSDYNTDSRNLNDALEEIGNQLRGTHRDYVAQDEASQAKVNSLMGRLQG